MFSNVDKVLDIGDDQLKLTLLLDRCTGEAFDLIEDCVMMTPEDGYRIALEKLEKRFGKNHLIARNYIDGVKNGKSIELTDVDGLVRLADNMVKCQNVLSHLRFTSDLNSTDTLVSIVERLPDCFQTKWVRRSSKILAQGRDPTFNDLTAFVEERANDYSSKYGQSYAERMIAKSQSSGHSEANSHEKQQLHDAITLATDTESTAGHESNKPRCLHCDRIGHIIWKCFKFKKLSTEDRCAVVKKLKVCVCCLKDGHNEINCDRTCLTCGGDHHSLLHPDERSNIEDNENENPKDN